MTQNGGAQPRGVSKTPEKTYDGHVFGLDGTIYPGDELLPGARRLIPGFEALAEEIIDTAVVTTTGRLPPNHPGATAFPIPEEPLWNALREAGVRTSGDAEEVDTVKASYDRGFDYPKLKIAYRRRLVAIRFCKRAMRVTTNPDRYGPFPGGRGDEHR